MLNSVTSVHKPVRKKSSKIWGRNLAQQFKYCLEHPHLRLNPLHTTCASSTAQPCRQQVVGQTPGSLPSQDQIWDLGSWLHLGRPTAVKTWAMNQWMKNCLLSLCLSAKGKKKLRNPWITDKMLLLSNCKLCHLDWNMNFTNIYIIPFWVNS